MAVDYTLVSGSPLMIAHFHAGHGERVWEYSRGYYVHDVGATMIANRSSFYAMNQGSHIIYIATDKPRLGSVNGIEIRGGEQVSFEIHDGLYLFAMASNHDGLLRCSVDVIEVVSMPRHIVFPIERATALPPVPEPDRKRKFLEES